MVEGRRLVTFYEIMSRSKRIPIAIASPSDFALRYIRETEPYPGEWPGIAYCVDMRAAELWFARCGDSRAPFGEPFLWRALFERAEQIATVPFGAVDELISVVPEKPTFIFSISRCGSTLLSALLRACGANVVSEPDVLTQLSLLDRKQLTGTARTTISALIGACVASLAAQCGANPVLKLRSQCNTLAEELTGLFPCGRFICMLRGRLDWAHSRYRAVGGQPTQMAHICKRGIETYDRLWQFGVNPHLIWYEDVIASPASVLHKLADIGVPVDPGRPDVIASIMNRDSQDATPLARSALSDRRLSQSQVHEFEQEWCRIRPAELIAKHSLERGF